MEKPRSSILLLPPSPSLGPCLHIKTDRLNPISEALLVTDDTFALQDTLMRSVADENILGDIDLGPTDALPEDVRQLEYDAFFGASPLTSPSTSPSPSRSASPARHLSTKAQNLTARWDAEDSPPPCEISPPTALAATLLATDFKTTPMNTPTFGTSECPQPTNALIDASNPTKPHKAMQGNSKARRNKSKAHNRRRDKRGEIRTGESGSNPPARPATVAKHITPAVAIESTYDVADIPSASTGFVALPDDGGRVFKLKELIDDRGFTLVKCREKKTQAICDMNGLVIGVISPGPDDPEWLGVICAAYEELSASGRRCKIPKKCTKHRRGKFPAMNAGISFGGGQTHPGNLYHIPRNAEQLKRLTSSKAFTRIAGFGSGMLAAWAPKLHTYYKDHFDALLSSDPRLRRNFPNSIWAAAAFNFGPQTITAKHRDSANIPFGMCSITSLGDYDPTEGGHLVLWELKLVVEFPPGYTILIPSAAISHSNTPISRRETRGSFTQYSAGGLFRWVDHGFQKEADFEQELSDEQKEDVLAKNAARCKLGLSLFSTLDELRRL